MFIKILLLLFVTTSFGTASNTTINGSTTEITSPYQTCLEKLDMWTQQYKASLYNSLGCANGLCLITKFKFAKINHVKDRLPYVEKALEILNDSSSAHEKINNFYGLFDEELRRKPFQEAGSCRGKNGSTFSEQIKALKKTHCNINID